MRSCRLYGNQPLSESFLSIFNFIWQQYEVRWHCIRGRGYCYWSDYSGWSEQIVNTTSATVNVTRYDTAYVFEVRPRTAQGRGKPSQPLYYAVPAFSGMPTQFNCKVTSSKLNPFIVCHWLPPTDFNPSGFYVSSKYRPFLCEIILRVVRKIKVQHTLSNMANPSCPSWGGLHLVCPHWKCVHKWESSLPLIAIHFGGAYTLGIQSL